MKDTFCPPKSLLEGSSLTADRIGALTGRCLEVYAGEKSTQVYGPDVWLPDETLHALREPALVHLQHARPGSRLVG